MKEYSNKEIKVLRNPEKCIHAGECVKGLPQVFRRESTPWINMKEASSEEIMKIVDRCPDCGSELGSPFRIKSRVIEEIPEPQPVMVTEYKIAHYRCPCCRKEVVANDASCPHEGKFGNNTIAQATLLKYEDRLPHRKIESALNRMHGLKISPATIFDLTRRAAEAVQSEYDAILNKIRGAPILYVDETGIHVQGEKRWIWTFTTSSETFFVIRKSRGTKVLIEVLTRRFIGKINNGFDYWFTFIINPGVEPTNNRAERALRPQDWIVSKCLRQS